MTNRFDNAYEIWHNGASNPRGVARALVEAIDEAVEENGGSAGAADAAVQMILDQLCWLCGLPQPCMVGGRHIWMDVSEEVDKRRTPTLFAGFDNNRQHSVAINGGSEQ